MTKFITIAGKKQVGKDTLAKMMQDLLVSDPSSLRYRIDEDRLIRLCAASGSKSKGNAQFHHEQVHIIHFADVLKEVCRLLFGIPQELMETEDGKRSLTNVKWPWREDQHGFLDVWVPDPNGRFMTVREVLQFVGTELFRNQLDPDIWIKSVFNQTYDDHDVVIIADARFPNEAEMGKQHGCLVRIERDNGLEGDEHASEVLLDNYAITYDYLIRNDGEPEDLLAYAKEVLQREGLL